MRLKFVLSLLLIGVCFNSLAETEPGVVTVTSDLYSEPDRNLPAQTLVKADTRVTILEHSGVWYRVELDTPEKERGWIWFNVQPVSNISWLERLRRVMRGGYSTQEPTSVATIGIRGLGPGDIKKANPDPQAMAAMDRYRSNPDKARRHAGSAGLRSQNIAYLIVSSEPESESDTSSGDQFGVPSR